MLLESFKSPWLKSWIFLEGYAVRIYVIIIVCHISASPLCSSFKALFLPIVWLFQLLGALTNAGGGGVDECAFKCKNGAKPNHRPGHVPEHNGCGSYGVKVQRWKVVLRQ